MASMADHPSTTVASENLGDFVLYPSHPTLESYSDILAHDSSRHEDSYSKQDFSSSMSNPYSTMTSYDSYDSLTAYSSSHQSFYDTPQFVLDTPQDGSHCQRTPSGSPATSASHSFDPPPSTLSSASGASVQSASSSAIGSPYSRASQILPGAEAWADSSNHGLGIRPGIVQNDNYEHEHYMSNTFEHDLMFADNKVPSGFVDPSLIQPFQTPATLQSSDAPYPSEVNSFHSPQIELYQPPSPVPSNASDRSQRRSGSATIKHGSQSPYLHTQLYQPYPQHQPRRPSITSSYSRNSQGSPRSGSYELDEEGREKGRCHFPDCGKVFKDLKAHMLTHQSERPEKCPIVNCDYHLKGFARKYDKNRHTLTHYKGTMVCGFCPGSGSAAEKSFNRADVFKRHLTSVHGVEQTPPNSRRKTSASASKKSATYPQDATGICSTCSLTFSSAQEFYEHLDDCVLRVVQQEEPSEANNERHLASMENDEAVRATMDRHALPASHEYPFQGELAIGEEDEEEEEDDTRDDGNDDTWTSGRTGARNSGKGAIKANKAKSS